MGDNWLTAHPLIKHDKCVKIRENSISSRLPVVVEQVYRFLKGSSRNAEAFLIRTFVISEV